MQIKRAGTGEWSEKKVKEKTRWGRGRGEKEEAKKRGREREGKREKVGDEGKRWSAARATSPLHHLLHCCIEDVAPGLGRDTICLLYAAPILQDYGAFIVLDIVAVMR